jgi:hypothetical protein
MLRLRAVAVLALVVCVASLGGCKQGAKTLVKAGGTVKYKGEAVKGATVTFMFGSEIATGITDENGKFNLTTAGREGAPIGKAKVSVTKVANSAIASGMPANPTPKDYMAAMSKTKGQMMKDTQAAKSELPEKYSNPDNSGLTAETKSNAEENDFLFELQD